MAWQLKSVNKKKLTANNLFALVISIVYKLLMFEVYFHEGTTFMLHFYVLKVKTVKKHFKNFLFIICS